MRSEPFAEGKVLKIRNPQATRPWQHVLEPLRGYLMLAQTLYEDGAAFASGWNLGPDANDVQPVGSIVERSRVCGVPRLPGRLTISDDRDWERLLVRGRVYASN
jgi:hypothetical protein